MDKIKLITDTASDITLEDAAKLGIHLIPINFTVDGKPVKDRYDMTADDFYNYIEAGNEVPKTSQITVMEHIEEFKKFSDEYSIIYIPISSVGSGTFQSANLAKNEILEENPNADITILDCKSYSYGYGYWIMEAAKMLNNGASKDEIIKFMNNCFEKTEIRLVPTTMEYLKKGGRVSSTAKIIADILDISPILAIEDGLVVGKDKVRGKKKAMSKIIETMSQNADPDSGMPIIIMHARNDEMAGKLKEKIIEKTDFRDIVTAELGPTIGINTGPGAYALVYLTK